MPSSSIRFLIYAFVLSLTWSSAFAQPPAKASIRAASLGDSQFVPPVVLQLGDSQTDALPSSARASSHPHGDQVCASGCAASRHPTPALSPTHFAELIAAFAKEPADAESKSLDSLVFYGPQSAMYLKAPSVSLSAEHTKRLKRELAVADLVVQLRVVDENGRTRVALPPTRVPQHVRQEFSMVVQDFQPTITSGTVKRVGVKHAWQRL